MLGSVVAVYSNGTRGTVGGLWSEWGTPDVYSSSGFVSGSSANWTSEQNGPGYHFTAVLSNGFIGNGGDTYLAYVLCRQGL